MSQASSLIAPPASVPQPGPRPAARIPFIQRPAAVRYTVSAVVVTIACIVGRTVPIIAKNAPFSPALAAILTLAYLAGAGPTLLATFLGAALLAAAHVIADIKAGSEWSYDLRLLSFTSLGVLASWISSQWQMRTSILRDREQKLRVLLENMPIVLWSTDAELRLTSSSTTMPYVFDAIKAAQGKAIDPDLFRVAPAGWLPATAQRSAAKGEAVSYEFANGERHFSVHLEPLYGAGGKLSGSFGMAWDITAQHLAEADAARAHQELEARVTARTDELAKANLGLMKQIAERKLAEQQRDAEREKANAERTARAEAEAAKKAMDHFLATLSHELRTPMTPVLMTVSSMQDDMRLPEDARANLQMVRRNVELEARLIDDLLDLTRISRGKLQITMKSTEVHSLLRHAVDVCQADADTKKLKLMLEMPATETHVRGDATRLQQVFWNLLRNAIKFTPENGTIYLASSNDGDKLVVNIKDTGIGIHPQTLLRIFDAFEQGGPETTRRFGGLGLGLAISKAIVDLHGGTISAHSDGIGHGSIFTVTLLTVAAPVQVAVAPTLAGSGTTSLRILLVEDHPDTRKATARLLTSLGHDVATADCVQSALETADARAFDLMISDLGLPDGSGLELMRQIKQRHQLKGIALSGFGMDADLKESSDAGFVCHLVKPVPLEQLEAAVRQVSGLETTRT